MENDKEQGDHQAAGEIDKVVRASIEDGGREPRKDDGEQCAERAAVKPGKVGE